MKVKWNTRRCMNLNFPAFSLHITILKSLARCQQLFKRPKVRQASDTRPFDCHLWVVAVSAEGAVSRTDVTTRHVQLRILTSGQQQRRLVAHLGYVILHSPGGQSTWYSVIRGGMFLCVTHTCHLSDTTPELPSVSTLGTK